MSDNTKEYDRTLQPGDRFEWVRSRQKPLQYPVGGTGVIVKMHALPEAAYYQVDGGKYENMAAYMCAMRRIDDSKSFVPEDWS